MATATTVYGIGSRDDARPAGRGARVRDFHKSEHFDDSGPHQRCYAPMTLPRFFQLRFTIEMISQQSVTNDERLSRVLNDVINRVEEQQKGKDGP